MSTQISTYNENRLALLISVNGAANVTINTQSNDVNLSTPLGITIIPGANYLFSWQTHGELVWQRWYASCVNATICIWEWFGSINLGGPIYTPCKTIFDINVNVNVNNTVCKGSKKLNKASCNFLRHMIDKRKQELKGN